MEHQWRHRIPMAGRHHFRFIEPWVQHWILLDTTCKSSGQAGVSAQGQGAGAASDHQSIGRACGGTGLRQMFGGTANKQ